MDLNTNGAKAIAALVALNAGLLFSHHAVVSRVAVPRVEAKVAARGEICKAKAEAHLAALQARLEARQAVRDAMRARKDAIAQAQRAVIIAPRANAPKMRSSVSDYVRCLVSSGVHGIIGGV